MKTYTFTDNYAKQPELWKEIARDTFEWAKKRDCVMDEDGKVGNYFKIAPTPGKKRETKPVWSKQFQILQKRGEIELYEMPPQEAWDNVIDMILMLRLPLNKADFEGYYFGTEGMEGSYVGSEINVWFGWTTRVLRHINILLNNESIALTEPHLVGRLKKELNHHTVARFLAETKSIRLLSSEPYQNSLAEALLLAENDSDSDSAAD